MDLIERQAALDALGDEPEVWTGKDEYAMGLNNQWHYDKNAILKCPSAQPQSTMGQTNDTAQSTNDCISRQAAIEDIREYKVEPNHCCDESEIKGYNDGLDTAISALATLPSAQPETSRIENALHGKSPEEQYDFIWWLLQGYAMNFTDSRRATIEWLRGDRNESN